MDTTNLQEQIIALFREAGPAHHKAYIETNGADPDWPMWYAEGCISKLEGGKSSL